MTKIPDAFNDVGIVPKGFRVLVLPMETETKTEGGLILVEETVKKEKAANIRGQVIALGSDCYADKRSAYCEEGDFVLFAKYAGLLYTGADGQEYRVINDEDIVAVLNPQLVAEGKV